MGLLINWLLCTIAALALPPIAGRQSKASALTPNGSGAPREHRMERRVRPSHRE